MLDELKRQFGELGSMKYYLLLVLVSFGGFIWTEFNGYSVLGDDTDSRETHRAHTGQYFYHK